MANAPLPILLAMSMVLICAGLGVKGVPVGATGVALGVGVMVGTAVFPGKGVAVGVTGVGVFVSTTE